jgi:hypothetical protein
MLLLAVAVVATGCRPTARSSSVVGDAAIATDAAASDSSAAGALASLPDASPAALMPDAEVGPFVERLSESPGAFPSDDYVSNEPSYLEVADALRNPALAGRAYVGVGPEQNYTYVALLAPAVAYVVDIRRGNLLEHMVLRGCFEQGATRAGFLEALLARRAGAGAEAGDLEALVAAFAKAPADRALRDAGVARTLALMDRLHVRREMGDADAVARIHDSFFSRGLAIAYTMKNSGRKYPTLAETLSQRDPDGAAASFLATDDLYARVRARVVENRVIPVVGDLGGGHALRAIADDARARGLVLGAFYASNVEQYLFDAGTHGAFVANVRALPRDDASLIVRVWFDQGRPHPLQRSGLRTTTLAFGASAFVARAEQRPFGSYWDVVTAAAR